MKKAVIKIYKDRDRKELVTSYEIEYFTIDALNNHYLMAQMMYAEDFVVAYCSNYEYYCDASYVELTNNLN